MVLVERNEKTPKRIPKLLQKRGGSHFERGDEHSAILKQKVFYKRATPFYKKNPKENQMVLTKVYLV